MEKARNSATEREKDQRGEGWSETPGAWKRETRKPEEEEGRREKEGRSESWKGEGGVRGQEGGRETARRRSRKGMRRKQAREREHREG